MYVECSVEKYISTCIYTLAIKVNPGQVEKCVGECL